MNLGVTSPSLYRSFTGREFPRNPSSLLWPVNRRIGALLPARTDHWWSVDATTDIAMLGEEVASALELYALPFLDHLKTASQFQGAVLSDPTVTALSEGQSLLVRATLAVQLGEKEQARALLDEAIERYRGKPFEGTVRRVATELAPQLHDA